VLKIVCPPNTTAAGLEITEGLEPKPPRVTVCGLPGALSATVIVPLLKNVAVGVKVTITVQVAPAAREVGQSCVPLYSPVTVMPLISNGKTPWFVMITGCGALGRPTATKPNCRFAGAKLIAGSIPSPERLKRCGLSAALLLIVMVPARAPMAVGENRMLIGHDAAASRVAGQSLVLAKLVPLVTMLEMLRF
jgi:hypothetical protein